MDATLQKQFENLIRIIRQGQTQTTALLHKSSDELQYAIDNEEKHDVIFGAGKAAARLNDAKVIIDTNQNTALAQIAEIVDRVNGEMNALRARLPEAEGQTVDPNDIPNFEPHNPYAGVDPADLKDQGPEHGGRGMTMAEIVETGM